MNDEMGTLLDVPFRFVRRPAPLPGDLRPDWRIAILVLLLHRFRGSRATIQQLHVLNWAIRTTQSRATFRAALQGSLDDLERPIIRVEPSLNRAIDLAIGEQLVTREGNKLLLAEKGATYAKFLWRAHDVLREERQFLQDFNGKITSQMIDRVLKWNDI